MNTIRRGLLVAVAFVALGTAKAFAAAPPESMPIWRAQLDVTVCNATYADTDDRLIVQLNDSNVTYLDNPAKDDFALGSVGRFELIPFTGTTPMTLSSITKLRLSMADNDGIKICGTACW